MKTNIIDGKKIADDILNRLKPEVALLHTKSTDPKLVVVMVGEHKPSQTYIKKKQEASEKVGIEFALHKFPANIEKNKLIAEIKKIQKKENPSGLIIQLPLPEPLYTPEVLNAVDPSIDVDCLTSENIGRLVMNTGFLLPPTPYAVKRILKNIDVGIKGKNICIIGAGALVGKPLSIILSNKEATVTLCHKETKDIKKKCLESDIIITAVGKKDLLRGNMVKKGTVVIDTGIYFENKKMYGDVNFAEVSKKASHITPVPGGVGPITVALLLKNVITCAKRKI
ncbi:MAG: bifunctional 5,10-methylenetetrahydrofolate dehydrogenase/5,10-methenyltetrahydrofolate cyclohydrolase [Candidatus Magasanikbacteria bacterium]|nr:bifunctional 5,10-methylenetetrahydrofolate dehydrogenase/5,10-methenyltetrahydrofolate cyclohydrolase [Candidatus Magasanikbacteria bacterium]MBT4314907.1 bifunctional 5,10-methylenetetrahydrofolate dehydrogenase/5,10-methenyltetrahydrofolate cyclohydrolase [Candidatus Magasanikbacteria bacterium]MBT4546863.1 bifunctional 5,10-methylenetetrahydrofolate dehydrogenase/5,10-methenyltetrahydrofolate cyclohydrolase [Candidatus Magasanikbacteria bacterium]MBT6819223.1 bifunctional 5,10-methylenete